MRRASATLTSVGFTTFVLHHLPQAPARVLDVGCGDRGGVVPALVDAGYDAFGPPSLDEWRWSHPGLHPSDVVLGALRARYDEVALEWVPCFHHWLGDVESPDRIGYVWAGARMSTTRSSAASR